MKRLESQSQKLRVRGTLAKSPEIVWRTHKPLAEMPLPDPVHHHAAGQRMIGRSQPVRKFEPPATDVVDRRLQFAHDNSQAELPRNLFSSR